MSLTLLAPAPIMLVIIITASTGEQVMQGMQVTHLGQGAQQEQQALQALLELPEPMVLQALLVLPELMALQELPEPTGQQQPVPMDSRVEVEEFLS